MKPALKKALGIASALLLVLLAVWGVMQGRTEQAKEREREAPVEAPKRLEALPNGGVVVRLEPEARAALDLAVQELRPTSVQAGLDLSGVILDPIPFLDLQGKLRSARAEAQAARSAVEAARASLERLQALNREDKGASDKALQEAISRLAAEEAKAAVTRAEAERLEAAWRQQGLPPDLGAFLAFKRALVRLELPLGQDPPTRYGALSARLAEEDQARPLRMLGLASGAAPGTGGLALLGVLDGGGLRPGQPVEAFLPTGASGQGLVPPASSLLRAEGRVWAYVERPDGRFERRVLKLLHPAGGSFAVEGLAPGQKVVTRGAEALLAEEFRSQLHAGEEGQ